MQAFPPALTSLLFGVSVIILAIITISGGSSMYLRLNIRTHTLPCVEPLSAFSSFTRVSCWLSNPWNCLLYSSKYSTIRCYHDCLAFRALRTSQHPGVSLVRILSCYVPLHNRILQCLLLQIFQHCLTWQCRGYIARDVYLQKIIIHY